MLIRAGLTGGIATGKSTVLETFRDLGCFQLDADAVVHELFEPESPLVPLIAAGFGSKVMLPNGGINRAALASLVFPDPDRLQELEGMVHPEVVRILNGRAGALETELRKEGRDGVLVIDAALLFEKKPDLGLHRVIVTACPEEEQIRRLSARAHLSRAEATLRVRIQMPCEEKVRLADYVVDTSGPLERTRKETLKVYERLVADLKALGKGRKLRPRAFA